MHGGGGGQTGIALHDNGLHDIHVILIRGGGGVTITLLQKVRALLINLNDEWFVNGEVHHVMAKNPEYVHRHVAITHYHKQYSQHNKFTLMR